MTALEVIGLSASYGDRAVLRNLDLTVTSGVTAVLGSSGCGKTTLLRVVAGFHTPDAGAVRIAGREVNGAGRAVPPRSRNIGYVPQEGALFPHLSVADNIAFGLSRAERRHAARTTEMLDLVELPADVADRFPHEISGGQQQRVAVARALAARPTLVLLDEPFSSLDAGLREETGRAVVRAIRAGGAAAILVTHDQDEALSLSDQVAVMADGRFLQVGPPTEVYLSPADGQVAGFVGHALLLDGVVEPGEDRVAHSVLGGVRLRQAAPTGHVRLAVRAEQVQVSPDPATGTPGTVREVSFFGHDATVRVRLDSGEELTARTPAGAIPTAGDRVGLQVVGEVVAFPESAP